MGVAAPVIPVLAQTPLRQSITVTASTYPIPFEDLSRTVAVLTSEQIARLPVRSVVEVLQYISSVDLHSRAPFGVQADISVRGGDFSQTLILVDGMRLNDAQTGHHNADIPVLLEDVERIEILCGPGSSLYGADAFGGTVNVVTKKKSKGIKAGVSGGQYGFVESFVDAGFEKGNLSELFGVQFNRSSGFAYDRDFQTYGFTSRTNWGERSSLLLSHLSKDFGAMGFYGNSPSREWTNTTFLGFERQWIVKPSWDLTSQTYYRTHGDHFLWDINNPGFFENFHRTHSPGVQVRLRHTVSEETRWTLGVDGGGDWIRSNSLGNHSLGHVSFLGELQRKLGSKAVLAPGIRFDTYSNFGNSLNPSISGSWWVLPTIKVRSSAGHAFRVPTFTELYYHDPNNQASSNLKPEQAWGLEAGADWLFRSSWMATLSWFARDERDAIDWVRESPQQAWRSTNLRNVDTRGVELGIQHLIPAGRMEIQYTYLSTDAGAVPFLSKYVLDYARHTVIGFASLSLPKSINFGPRVSYKFRVDGRDYWVLDCRLGRRFGRFEAYLEGSNLTNSRYQEIPGVDMPGRWLRAGLSMMRF